MKRWPRPSALRAAGFEPVPHVAVRNFATSTALDDFLARLNGEADVTRVLVIAGDRAEFGPFRRALDVIESGLLQRRGIRGIGIAGYPDGHPRIGADELDRALKDKIVSRRGGRPRGRNRHPVLLRGARHPRLRRAAARAPASTHPVRIGLAGPTGPASLLRYASRCGVRASAHALTQRAGLVLQMFGMTVPDDLVRDLGRRRARRMSACISFRSAGCRRAPDGPAPSPPAASAIEADSGFRVAPERQES